MAEAGQKVAIVTGGAQGIGRGIAAQLASDGYAILIADIRLEAAEKTAAELQRAGAGSAAGQVDVSDADARSATVAAAQVDVSDADACGAMVARAVEQFGRVDVLVNNAGISKPGPSLEVSPADWQRMIGIQLNGAFFCSQAVGRQMVAQGWGGAIVNITSINAEAAFPQRASYACAKAGVTMLTKTLAIEWAQYKIRVNAVGPGHTDTEMTARLVAQGLYDLETVRHRYPLGRLAQVQDVANAVSFLVSDKADFITGHALYVDGGYLAYGYW